MEEGGAVRISARLMARTDALRIVKKNRPRQNKFLFSLSAESEARWAARERGRSFWPPTLHLEVRRRHALHVRRACCTPTRALPAGRACATARALLAAPVREPHFVA